MIWRMNGWAAKVGVEGDYEAVADKARESFVNMVGSTGYKLAPSE